MGKVYTLFDNNVPAYIYTGCCNCLSVMGVSLCKTQDRGCCSYFPRFSLSEIRRMSKSILGLRTLDSILKHPGTVLEPFSIQSAGDFDKASYEAYLIKDRRGDLSSINDRTLFFKTCPFVKSKVGCTIPVQFRCSVCNFFLCSEVMERPDLKDAFKPYLEARSEYMRWVYYENIALEHQLLENNLHLIKNFDLTMEFLKESPLAQYDFPLLDPITFDDGNSVGA